MKKQNAVLIFIATFLVFCTIFATPKTKAFASSNDGEVFTEYYCRNALKELENSKALLFAYDKIVEGVENCTSKINVYDGENPISIEEIDVVMDAYRRDHAEHFWMNSGYSVLYNTVTVNSIEATYLFSGSALERAKAEMEQAIEQILSGITEEMSEFEKELYLHDTLADRITYVESENAHNAYGALVEGKVVCEGYAEALQVLLHRVGIQSFQAYGTSYNPSKNTFEPHAWNTVKINGKYYHVDLTWNDQTSALYHAYFNVSDQIITLDHVLDETAFALPKCDSSDDNYFNVYPGRLAEFSVKSVGQLLIANDLRASVYVVGNEQAFIQWLENNIRSIAFECKVFGEFKYSYAKLGGEVVVEIITCKHRNLTEVEAVEAKCDKDGNIAYFTCDDCGRWFKDISAEEEILDKEKVKTVKEHNWSLSVQDAEHLRQKADACTNHSTYWKECSECHKISYTEYFEGGETGEHVYLEEWEKDKTHHWRTCIACGEQVQKEEHEPNIPKPTLLDKQTCKECKEVLAQAEIITNKNYLYAGVGVFALIVLLSVISSFKKK